MKKIMLVVATAAVLASCNKNEYTGVNPADNQIGFQTLNDRVPGTRIANDASDDYKVYSRLSTGGTAWYIDDVVGGTTNLPENGPYYWPQAPLNFYAWAPAAGANITPTIGTGWPTPTISIDYTVPTAADQDFTIATPITGQTVANDAGKVPYQFKHMLSKISVAVNLLPALTTAGYTVDMTSATVDLVVAESKGTINPTAATPSWTLGTPASPATYTGKLSYMIIPQPSVGCSIQVKNVRVLLNGQTFFSGNLSTYALKTGDITSPTANEFVQGSHYNMTFTVDTGSTDGAGNDIFAIIDFEAHLATWANQNVSVTQP